MRTFESVTYWRGAGCVLRVVCKGFRTFESAEAFSKDGSSHYAYRVLFDSGNFLLVSSLGEVSLLSDADVSFYLEMSDGSIVFEPSLKEKLVTTKNSVTFERFVPVLEHVS